MNRKAHTSQPGSRVKGQGAHAHATQYKILNLLGDYKVSEISIMVVKVEVYETSSNFLAYNAERWTFITYELNRRLRVCYRDELLVLGLSP